MSASPSPVVKAVRRLICRPVPRYMRATGNLRTDVQAKRRAARAIQVPEVSIEVVKLAEVIELTEAIEQLPTKIKLPEIQEAVAGSKLPSDDSPVYLVPGIQNSKFKQDPCHFCD